uniref:UPF0729 protein n=1 Tax=Rhabditophanes sp. KR3021 TaxID=114890 RepID=A0AC35UCL3_9BILA
MVCLPCVVLPIFLAIYLKFIQPLIFRFMPDTWKAKLDSILYPTCPLNIPKNQTETAAKEIMEDEADTLSKSSENKKID